MNIDLTFRGWYKDGKLVDWTPEGTWLNVTGFHAGATFDGDIYLGLGEDCDLTEPMEQGYVPHFEMSKGKQDPSGSWSYAKQVALATEAIDYVECFIERVNKQAEANMEKTGKLEGSHYAAMQTVLKKMQIELDRTKQGLW